MASVKKPYELMVRCDNCLMVHTLKLPFGSEWQDFKFKQSINRPVNNQAGKFEIDENDAKQFSAEFCDNCGSNKLLRWQPSSVH